MSMTLDDAATIRAFRHGDDAAFDTVVEEYRQELLRHARRRCPDDATAEDLVQETFVRAYRGFGRLPDDSRVRPWLHQILRNVCIDDAHRRHREIDKVDRVIAESSVNCFDVGPEETLGLDLDFVALEQAMTDIPATHRDAFVQRVVDGLEYDEIAIRGGVSEPNARARVSRARTALRRAMQGAAAIPLTLYLVVRRPGRHALAVAPGDPSAATVAPSTATAASTASRLATTLAPALDAATATAGSAVHTVPMLAKTAVGIGAVATMAFATAPERPIEIPPAVTVEVTTDALDGASVVIAAEPAPAQAVTVPPTTAAATTTNPATTTPVAELLAPMVAVVASTADGAAAGPGPSSGPAPGATDTPVAPTTLPATTVPSTTVPPTTLPPLVGGSLQASVSVTPAGPRLDLAGTVTITVADTSSGSLSGRLGVGDPDAAGLRRIDGAIILILPGGTIELRLAGHATSAENTAVGVPPTSLTMSGVYRASGATGQLVTSGSFSGSLSGGTLTLSMAP